MSGLAFADLDHLTRGRTGTIDAPCPLCSTIHNPRRKVLRIWRSEPEFASFYCARCTAKGWAAEDSRDQRPRPSPERLHELRQEAEKREAEERGRKLALARRLWASRRPMQGTPAERYLREARGYRGPLPATLGYLPVNGSHAHAMVAAFGLADEPEPGVLAITDEAVVGIHVTRLSPDGSGKADGQAKIMIGRSSGFPIVVAPPNDLLGLAITEGIEDALSVHAATGLGAWAAGSAGRLPALADKIPNYVEVVTVAAHADPAGQAGALALAEALTARGIEAIVTGVTS